MIHQRKVRFPHHPAVFLLMFTLVGEPAVASEPAVEFNRDIRGILSNNCFQCHGPDENERQAELRLDQPTEVGIELASGTRAIVPGEPDQSELIRRITSPHDDERMPPANFGKRLTEREVQLLQDWIGQGANFAKHWSYQLPTRAATPRVSNMAWPKNKIDYFLLARLEAEERTPSPEADRYTLIHRLSLDLTGLPPAWEDVERFVEDSESEAFEHLVDQLLEKQSYGEHWARSWLDLARYADSTGYANDPVRTIWAYRDWVIRAINNNLPFDQFTIEQLAGDLLPDPTEDQLIATAFHRNTPNNSEGGTDNEEFRNVAVVDRVNTTMAVWMGTTMACAQCHNHKFDPISQEDYFRVLAIFNNTEDADTNEEHPLYEVWKEEQLQQKAKWQQELTSVKAQLKSWTAPESYDLFGQLVDIENQLVELKPFTTIPIMRELAADHRRKTYIQHRGNFLDLGKQVTPGLPSAFPTAPEFSTPDRLAFAKWLVDKTNPLTPRIIANRYWEAIFGVGLVRTSEEFGAQGELPSHPKLLDWLATELVRLKWDTKAFLRLLVTSAAYRQSSATNPQQYEQDPENRLLARGPRFRLSAETIRDQALSVSGLLSEKMYGPPVRPPQPQLGVRAAFGSAVDWAPSEGDDRYRRGLYTTWRRSNLYPSMAIFDAPNREFCTLRRTHTNTPLQALVTLNDPVYVEAAQALARRMIAYKTSLQDKARHGVRLCLARNPDPTELGQLVTLYEKSRQKLAQDPDKALRLAASSPDKCPEGFNAVDLAAWTVVGNVLLNLDEMFLKR